MVLADSWDEQMIQRARRALDENDPRVAVVLAGVAAEMLIENLFELLLERRGLTPRSTAGLVAGALHDRNLASPLTKELFEHLGGVAVTEESFPSLRRYRAHLTRRNEVVHGRLKLVHQKDGEASIRAVEMFRAELLDALTSPGGALTEADRE
jgi:hypothetical protein